jgi:putative Mg2+ transporter-C (MgtC) family protein
MLVSVGSALFVMIPLQLDLSPSPESLSRVIQGVTAGIGFLGAGEILQWQAPGKPKILGLTSAAALWVAAALGLLAGCGLWRLCLIGAVVTYFVLSSAKKLEARLFRKHPPEEDS